MIDTLNRDGFVIVSDVIAAVDVHSLIAAISDADIARSARRGEVYGARNLLDLGTVRGLADSSHIRALVEHAISPLARPVRGLFFDKTQNANWPVAWHQDLTVALSGKGEAVGWQKWTVKAGVVHAQPPAEFLNRMITLRIHLDDCDSDNGALKVLPGTHSRGRLSPDDIAFARKTIVPVLCAARAGSVLLMKPLLLHASSPARAPSHRRVIHLEFAASDALPASLSWPVAA